MDFALTPEQEAFRDRVRTWLAANIPREWKAMASTEVPRPEAYELLKRWQAKLKAVKAELRRRMHTSVPDMGRYVRAVVMGHMRYYAVPMNAVSVSDFRMGVIRIWRRVLKRRSQKSHMPWTRMQLYIARWVPQTHVCHPYPWQRFGVIT